uniref:cilia- and flagella-associated protein 157-like n=1 Tax=Scatophagus argus TaxID=75038 RepID=UPI001ED81A16|nr:cilia- and flagella-associated protein 157-like [Scatophagus argus]
MQPSSSLFILIYSTSFSYQLKCNKLKKQSKDLAFQCNTLVKDKEDITDCMKFAVVSKKKLEELESQLWAIREDKEALELQHSQQMQKLQEQVDELNSVNMMQVAQCEEQKEQLKQMMQQLSDKESLEKQLVSQKEEHEAAMCRLKMEEELERKRLTEQIQMAVKKSVQMKTLNIVQEERTQLQESLQQTQFLLDKAMALRKKKVTLQDMKKKLCKETDHLNTHLNKNNQKSFTYKKELEQMKQRCQHLEMNLNDCRTKNKNRLDKERDLRQDMASVSEKCRQQTAETSQLAAELRKKSSRCQKLLAIMQKSIMILRQIALASENQCKKQMLLELLERTVPQQTVSTLSISKEKSSEWQKPQSTDPKTASAKTLNLDTDPLFQLSRFRPGDLGFVPRPPWIRKPAVPTTNPKTAPDPIILDVLESSIPVPVHIVPAKPPKVRRFLLYNSTHMEAQTSRLRWQKGANGSSQQ